MKKTTDEGTGMTAAEWRKKIMLPVGFLTDLWSGEQDAILAGFERFIREDLEMRSLGCFVLYDPAGYVLIFTDQSISNTRVERFFTYIHGIKNAVVAFTEYPRPVAVPGEQAASSVQDQLALRADEAAGMLGDDLGVEQGLTPEQEALYVAAVSAVEKLSSSLKHDMARAADEAFERRCQVADVAIEDSVRHGDPETESEMD